MRLTDTQKMALEVLYDADAKAKGKALQSDAWLGAREGVSGNTLGALEDRGLVKVTWRDRPYRRLVGRINDEGRRLVESRRAKAAKAPDTITFESNGQTHEAVVSLHPARTVAGALTAEHAGQQYAISIALGEIPGHPGIGYIARPVS